MPKRAVKFLFTALFFCVVVQSPAYALWEQSQSKLGKEAYERLINKNLELRREVESLVKAQERLKDIYRLLLEKIKVLQRDKSLLVKNSKAADDAELERKKTIDGLNKELALAGERISAMERLAGKTGAAVKAGTDVYYEKNILNLKDSLDVSEKKYDKVAAEKQALEKEFKKIQENIGKQDERAKKLTADLKLQYAAAEAEGRKIEELSGQLTLARAGQESAAKELEKLGSALEEKETELKNQRAKAAEYEEEAKKADRLRKDYGEKRDELAAAAKRTLENREAELSGKESRLKEMALELERADTKARSLEKSAAISGRDIKRYEERLKEAGKSISKFRTDLDAAGSALKLKDKELEDLSSARKAQDGRLKELGKSINDNKKVMEDQAKKLRIQSERINDLEAVMELANSSLKTAESELMAKKEEAKKLEGIFSKASLKKKYPGMLKKSAAEKFRESPAAERVKAAIARLDARRKAEEEERASLGGELVKSDAEADALKGKLKAADQDIEKAKRSIDEAKAMAKKNSEDAAAEEEKLNVLRDAFAKAAAAQKNADAKLADTLKKTADMENAAKKGAADTPKNAAGRSKEAAPLERNIEKAKADEKIVREESQDAENKCKELELAIDEAQAGLKEGLAGRGASEKEKIGAFVRDIEKARAEKLALNKDFQYLKKKSELLKGKEGILLDSIKSDDQEIRGLKKIIEKEMVGIGIAQGASAGPGEAGKGLVNKAEGALSDLNDEIKALKDRNEKLRRDLYSSRESEKKALRKAELMGKAPKALKEKIDKERLDMHYNLAVVYDMHGMYRDAEREYLKCLAINPDDAGVHYNLGILYDDKLNNNHRALAHYNKYLSLRPMGENVMQVRGWIIDIELQDRLGDEVR